MKKFILLTSVLTIFCLATFAKNIDENTAMRVGESFLLHAAKTMNSSSPLNLVYKESSNKNNVLGKTQATTYFYIFNQGANGFVIVSGDDNVTPILGYSDESSFDPNNVPTSVQKLLEEYKKQISYIIDKNISATQEIQEKWTNYTNGTVPSIARGARSVNPLVLTKWNQNPYENALCPFDYTYNKRTVAGCPATAMAQIMKYWNFPATGTGFHSYNHQKYGTLSATFGGTNYQWSSMPNILSSANSAVATLMYHCGVSVGTNYGVGGSTSYVILSASPTPQRTCENAYKTFFGYDASTLRGLQRSNYSDSSWVSLLKNELDQSRPIQYAGYGSGGGHTWVCDGYDNNDFFHMNWGWGGNSDGYFELEALNPAALGAGGGSGGFNSSQQAIVGIKPSTAVIPQTYDLRLFSNINMPSTQISYTDSFSLSLGIANFGTDSFSGDIGAAIFDQNNDLIDWMDVKTGVTINSNALYSPTFYNSGNTAFVPGTYYASIFYKTNSQDWKIIGNGSYNNSKQFQVYYSSFLQTNSLFTITTNGGKLIQGSPATINVDVKNTDSATFYGQLRVSLSNLNGSWAQDIQTLNENNGLLLNYNYINGNNFSGTVTIAPGTYLMNISFKEKDSTNWYYAGSTNFPNPIYVTVEAPELSPDQYEDNNTIDSAYLLPIAFSGDTANVNTVGSNIHIGSDNDFYKINLPTGYNYTISARLHDSYNSGNGNMYSEDGLFSYSTDSGATWSDNFDDVMSGNITLQNGGTVFFHAAPYFSGSTGTYLLDMKINRTEIPTGVTDFEAINSINIYPNPTTDFVNIDLNELSEKSTSISIYNIQGQQINSTTVINEKNIKIPLSGLNSGVYFVKVLSSEGTLTKELIIK